MQNLCKFQYLHKNVILFVLLNQFCFWIVPYIVDSYILVAEEYIHENTS